MTGQACSGGAKAGSRGTNRLACCMSATLRQAPCTPGQPHWMAHGSTCIEFIRPCRGSWETMRRMIGQSHPLGMTGRVLANCTLWRQTRAGEPARQARQFCNLNWPPSEGPGSILDHTWDSQSGASPATRMMSLKRTRNDGFRWDHVHARTKLVGAFSIYF